MVSDIYFPSPPLAHFFNSFYYYKGFVPEHNIDRFVPDGNTEIIIDLTDFPKFIYDNDTLEEKQGFRKYWASGVRRQFISIDSGRDSEMMILNLKKGKAFSFFQMPMAEMSDQVVEGDLIFGDFIVRLRDAIGTAKTISEKFEITEAFLCEKMKTHLRENNPFMDFTIQKMLDNPTQLTLQSLVSQVGYSQKHLIHLFKKHLGVSPKTYLRILRFQKAIQEIGQRGDIEWTHLAIDCGYYDQAHFINDFKNFSGFTPEEYLRRQKSFPNYIPVG